MPWGGQLVTGFADSQRILTERSWRSLDAAHLDATQPGWQRHSSLRGVFSSALQTNPPLHTRLRRQPGNPLSARASATVRARIEELAARTPRTATLGADQVRRDHLNQVIRARSDVRSTADSPDSGDAGSPVRRAG